MNDLQQIPAGDGELRWFFEGQPRLAFFWRPSDPEQCLAVAAYMGETKDLHIDAWPAAIERLRERVEASERTWPQRSGAHP